MSYTLEDLTRLAREQQAAEAALADAEQAVKDRKADLKKIREDRVPEVMGDLGMEKFTTVDGIEVEVVETVRASIPAKYKVEAFNWLRENGHSKLIKRTLTIVCRNDDHGQVLANRLEGEEFSDNPTVHPQTLAAFVREKLAKGEFIPQDELGVFIQKVSKVKVVT